ncbi:hypothetical protein ACFPK5_37145 [Streptomyces beijiangensis]|uniref:hypothetical protein n=1 Tax=Streptomyces beijiangensis TaxID=163361 RepID=UPI003619998E
MPLSGTARRSARRSNRWSGSVSTDRAATWAPPRAYTGTAAQHTPPDRAVRGLLEALGVRAAGVPDTLDAQVGPYRSLLPGCLPLITGRPPDRTLGAVTSRGRSASSGSWGTTPDRPAPGRTARPDVVRPDHARAQSGHRPR